MKLFTVVCLFALCVGCGTNTPNTTQPCDSPGPYCLLSLQQLTVAGLQRRHYQSRPAIIDQLGLPGGQNTYQRHYTAAGQPAFATLLARYDSDGLGMYSRIDIPSSTPPEQGFPVLIFAHGWIGKDNAPDYNFGYDTSSLYGEIIAGFTNAGFVVITPGFRGHGTVQKQQAQGLEYLQVWDNGSYLAPMFYVVDLLNLVAGLSWLEHTDWQQWGFNQPPRINWHQQSLLGHSQGGDVVLTTLAVAAGHATLAQQFSAASIWSGNIADRFTQAETFEPMATTTQAFLAGDGSWTGSATGRDGSINPNFVFAWPSDWIITPDTSSPQWTWQKERWSSSDVTVAVQRKYQQMYDTLNQYSGDITQAEFEVSTDTTGKYQVRHDPYVATTMAEIGGFNHAAQITTPLALHFSDRDYYSLPAWNKTVAARLSANGTPAYLFQYDGNTHSLKVSPHAWFSPPGTVAGIDTAIGRDRRLFLGLNPIASEQTD